MRRAVVLEPEREGNALFARRDELRDAIAIGIAEPEMRPYELDALRGRDRSRKRHHNRLRRMTCAAARCLAMCSAHS